MSKSTSKDYQLNVNLFTALLDGTFEKVVKQKKVTTKKIKNQSVKFMTQTFLK